MKAERPEYDEKGNELQTSDIPKKNEDGCYQPKQKKS